MGEYAAPPCSSYFAQTLGGWELLGLVLKKSLKWNPWVKLAWFLLNKLIGNLHPPPAASKRDQPLELVGAGVGFGGISLKWAIGQAIVHL